MSDTRSLRIELRKSWDSHLWRFFLVSDIESTQIDVAFDGEYEAQIGLAKALGRLMAPTEAQDDTARQE